MISRAKLAERNGKGRGVVITGLFLIKFSHSRNWGACLRLEIRIREFQRQMLYFLAVFLPNARLSQNVFGYIFLSSELAGPQVVAIALLLLLTRIRRTLSRFISVCKMYNNYFGIIFFLENVNFSFFFFQIHFHTPRSHFGSRARQQWLFIVTTKSPAILFDKKCANSFRDRAYIKLEHGLNVSNGLKFFSFSLFLYHI